MGSEMKLMTLNSRIRGSIVLGLFAVLLAANSWAQQANVDFTEIGLDQLMEMEVTSASKKEQGLFRAPSAVFVIKLRTSVF